MHPARQMATGAAKDLISIDINDCSNTSGTDTGTQSAAATRKEDVGAPRSPRSSPIPQLSPTNTNWTRTISSRITTDFISTSETGDRPVVRTRFHELLRCSGRHTAAPRSATPVEKNIIP